MKLHILKYLFLLIFEGEKTTKELTKEIGGTISNSYHAISALYGLNVIKHPPKRTHSWEVDTSKEIILTIEKLLFISRNNIEIKNLLLQPSIIRIGSNFFKNNKGMTLNNLIDVIGISNKTVIKTLGKLISANLLLKKIGRPNFYYVQQTTLSELFFKTCNELENLFVKNKKENILSIQEIITNLKNDNSVLILIYYGSSAKGTNDKLSDIDLLAVTRDKISRGEILTKYSNKKLDLSVYSKTGFLQFIKTYPDFVNNIVKAKILKGEEILKAIIQ